MNSGDLEQRAEVLIEALPYIQEFSGEQIVLKLGGSIMKQDSLKRSVVRDIVLLQYVGFKPLIVHGGGPAISETLSRMGIESEFVEGLRVTDRQTMSVVEMVLAGHVNKDLVGEIHRVGAKAIGLSGKDGRMLVAEPHPSGEKGDVELGHVGHVVSVNPTPIQLLEAKQYIPVIAPIGVDRSGTTYNINADEAAGALASGLESRKLIFITDVEGIMEEGERISTIHVDDIQAKIDAGVIRGGMIPKVNASRKALARGVNKAHVIDGTRMHSLLLELFTQEGIGTQILSDEEVPDV